jgi:NADH-quinone oxidoreductase subunit I
MQPLTNRSRPLAPRKMTWIEKLYFPAILNGLRITLNHLFRKNVTIRFPEEVRPFSPVYRGRHVLKRDGEGRERCTACGLCAVACPAEAITIVAAERKPGEEKLYREEKYAARYEINMLRCIFCGLCEEACPKEAIYLTERLAHPDYNREGFIFDKARLVEPVDISKRIDISNRISRHPAAPEKLSL